jgi:RND family efflux transporter MFP subunit
MSVKRNLWLPLSIIGIFTLIIFLLVTVKPQAKREQHAPESSMTVTTLPLKKQPYQITLHSFGRIQPGIQSTLVAQVNGQVIWISEQLREGGEFRQGDVLLRIDGRDYEVQADIAKAELASSKALLEEEMSKSEQAQREWKSANLTIPATPFVLRKPQLAAAQANLQSAQAKLNQAQLNLQRTSIRAPYNGRVRTQSVDLGDVVSNNSTLATIFASDYAEIKLAIKNSEIHLLNPAGGKIELVNTLSNTTETWSAELNRTAAAIDESSQQISIIARVLRPFNTPGKTPLLAGQYMDAKIYAREVTDAIVIPNKSLYQGHYVYLVRDGLLEKREVTLSWQNETDSIISAGLTEGDELITTPLGQVSSGTRVQTDGAQP